MRPTSLIALLLLSAPAVAEESRSMDAHEHGVGSLNIAIDGSIVAMEFEAPGADIVGFEYAAESAEDRRAIDDAVAVLARPSDLFSMPPAAECTVTEAKASLVMEEDAHDHGEEHASHDEHDDHEEEHASHDEHDHEEEHASHDEHDHEEEHASHDEHDEDEAGHTEFHAEYVLNCANPQSIDEIAFGYFEKFPNALELEVQVLTSAGAKAFEVERDLPSLDLGGLF